MNVYSDFTPVNTWKQPRRPSVGEWINKLMSIQTKEYYSVLRNELPSYEKEHQTHITKMKSQSEKATYCMSPIVRHFGKDKAM